MYDLSTKYLRVLLMPVFDLPSGVTYGREILLANPCHICITHRLGLMSIGSSLGRKSTFKKRFRPVSITLHSPTSKVWLAGRCTMVQVEL